MRFFILLLIFTKAYSQQDYRKYYQKIDSAALFHIQGNYSQSIDIYQSTFSEFIGFSDDYLSAIRTSIQMDSIIDSEFVIGYKKTRGSLIDLNWILKRYKKDGIITRKQKRKAVLSYVQTSPFKEKNKKYSKIIRQLFRQDQKARKKDSSIGYIDSLNNSTLQKCLSLDSSFLDHLQYGFIINQKLAILIFHQQYQLWSNSFHNLLEGVKYGYLNRGTVKYLIQREVAWGGHSFEMINDSLKYFKNTNDKICDSIPFYYSPFGSFKVYDSKLNKQIIIPFNPKYSESQIEKLRYYFYLCPLAVYNTIQTENISLFETEWCID